MKQNKVLSLLGLAMRGHNLVSGEFQTVESVKTGSAMLVIIAEDASGNTKKLFKDKYKYYDENDRLTQALKKSYRSSVME